MTYTCTFIHTCNKRSPVHCTYKHTFTQTSNSSYSSHYYKLYHLKQGAQIPGARSPWQLQFCMEAPNICASSVQNLLCAPFWHLQFWSGSYIFRKFVHIWFKAPVPKLWSMNTVRGTARSDAIKCGPVR